MKAIIMFSGGLDSTLAAKLMRDQGIDLIALHLTSPFCSCDNSRQGCRAASVVMAEQLGIEMITRAKGEDYYRILKNPRYGYGSGINPCIDCRIYGFFLAREEMEKRGARFIVTGEVLGQRPMSQRRQTLELIEKKSGLEGLIVRPLSAKHFPPTLPEVAGWVDRGKLLDISGRSRKEQIRLAEKYSLRDYPCPAGGCLLTDRGFAKRVRDLFAHSEEVTTTDFNILKLGRHFRLPSGEKLIISRNESENRRLEAMGKGRLTLVVSQDAPGPVVAIDNLNSRIPEKELTLAFRRYSKMKEGDLLLQFHHPGGEEKILRIEDKPTGDSLSLDEYHIR